MPDNERHGSNADDNRKDKKVETNKVFIKGFEIITNHKVFENSSFELLEKLYLLKNDDSLTDAEKRIKLQEIMKELR